MKRNFLKQVIVFAVISIFIIPPILATDYYVDANNGNNANAGLSSTTAFASIQNAADLTLPGDNVYIMNGTYSDAKNLNSNHFLILYITRSGNAGGYITYKNYPGHHPVISGLNCRWNAVAINGSYIIIDGLDFEGDNASLTLADATQAFNDAVNKVVNPQGKYNTNCISIGTANHVIVRNCKVHDFPGGGIGVGAADYITIENNMVYNNSWYCMYATSGISVFGPKAIDAVTDYKIIIRGNIVHNNKTQVPWYTGSGTGPFKLSDGNGIILDANNGTQNKPVYTGRTLVKDNVSFNNGGGGVHAYQAAHVDIINNTAYNNGTVVGYPEIDANQCSDVKIYNNILYARTGGNCNGNDANTIYDYNLYYNGTAYKKGSHDLTVTTAPQFEILAKDATADFRLKITNPAMNNGSNIAGQFSPADILGVARPVGFSTDMGAYEYPTVVHRAEIIIKQNSTEITDNTGSFDFGDVASTVPETVTFTIENPGDLALNLTGSPKVAVTGTGFSVATDAPVTIAANGSASFQVVLTTSATGVYSGNISIASNDADENPYNFSISGYGYDGTKILQTISFDALPLKVLGDADFSPAAISSAGLSVTYSSSNTGVATIVNGNLHLVSAGTATITASQTGDANTNVAKSVAQLLTVTPVLPPAGTNMITNPTFDVNTTGWSFSNKNSATATITSVPDAGYTSNAGKVTITNIGTTTSAGNVQFSTNVFVVKDRNYLITFTASADANRTIGLNFLLNASPYSTIFAKNDIAITTAPVTYGPYAFTSTYTGSIAFRFFLGASNIPAYFDDLEMTEVALLPISLLSFKGNLIGDKVLLNWTTTSEINAKEFVVEKSFDRLVFSGIEKVAAKNVLRGGSYSFTDDHTQPGSMFYRLKLVDNDGSFKYSKTIYLKGDLKAGGHLKVFPNPVFSFLTVSFADAGANASLNIFLTDGKKMGEYTITDGATQLNIDVSGLGRGRYVIVYKSKGLTTTGSFIK